MHWLKGIFSDFLSGGDSLHDALVERDHLNAQIDALEAGKPMVNIDGTPMMGDFDMNGNPFGVTNPDTFGGGIDDSWSGGGGGFNDDSFGGGGMGNDF